MMPLDFRGYVITRVVVIIPSLGVIIMALEVVLGSNPSGRRFLNLFAEEEGR